MARTHGDQTGELRGCNLDDVAGPVREALTGRATIVPRGDRCAEEQHCTVRILVMLINVTAGLVWEANASKAFLLMHGNLLGRSLIRTAVLSANLHLRT